MEPARRRERGEPAAVTANKRAKITRELHPVGFDPVPLLARMTVPGIWVYGRLDRSHPA